MPGKRVQFDDESWMALDLLGRDRMATFQELADEAFADLLKKHGRPVDLRAALRRSAHASADIVRLKDRDKPPEKSPRRAAKKSGKNRHREFRPGRISRARRGEA